MMRTEGDSASMDLKMYFFLHPANHLVYFQFFDFREELGIINVWRR